MDNNVKAKIGITMGDPSGIGPEVIVGALCDHRPVLFLRTGNYSATD
jgi:4-hydroxy-L-threonine phosphate dehydrogenase PdxA